MVPRREMGGIDCMTTSAPADFQARWQITAHAQAFDSVSARRQESFTFDCDHQDVRPISRTR